MKSGTKLKAHREAARLTQRQLCARIGFDQSYLSRVECGTMEGSLDLFRAVSKALGVPVSEFIAETSDPADIPADVLEIVNSLKRLPPPYRQAVKDLVESLVKTTLNIA